MMRLWASLILALLAEGLRNTQTHTQSIIKIVLIIGRTNNNVDTDDDNNDDHNDDDSNNR